MPVDSAGLIRVEARWEFTQKFGNGFFFPKKVGGVSDIAQAPANRRDRRYLAGGGLNDGYSSGCSSLDKGSAANECGVKFYAGCWL